MSGIEMVNILAGNHVDLRVPLGIQVTQLGKLLLLVICNIREMSFYDVRHCR